MPPIAPPSYVVAFALSRGRLARSHFSPEPMTWAQIHRYWHQAIAFGTALVYCVVSVDDPRLVVERI